MYLMSYLDEYKARKGKCEYCKYHDCYGSHRCVECYGGAFEDSVDLFSFIKAKASKSALDKFNESDEGKHLLDLVEQHHKAYNHSLDAYNSARDKFINSELERIEDLINSI